VGEVVVVEIRERLWKSRLHQ
jgi:hypothetical protein